MLAVADDDRSRIPCLVGVMRGSAAALGYFYGSALVARCCCGRRRVCQVMAGWLHGRHAGGRRSLGLLTCGGVRRCGPHGSLPCGGGVRLHGPRASLTCDGGVRRRGRSRASGGHRGGGGGRRRATSWPSWLADRRSRGVRRRADLIC